MSHRLSSTMDKTTSSSLLFSEKSKTGANVVPTVLRSNVFTTWPVICSPTCSLIYQQTLFQRLTLQLLIGGLPELSEDLTKESSLRRIRCLTTTVSLDMVMSTTQPHARPSLAKSICISTDAVRSFKVGLTGPSQALVWFNTRLLMISL